MYNIHSHYENIFSYLKTIVPDPVLLYFYPYGSINFENIECMHCNGNGTSPIVFCFDQEPITSDLEDLIRQLGESWSKNRHFIILNTEADSQIKNSIFQKLRKEKYKLHDCTYFFHIFAAADWYRSYYLNSDIIKPASRTITKKYITFNRITGNSRAYRGIFVAKLIEQGLIEHGHISFSHICPEHGPYSQSSMDLISKHNVDPALVYKTIQLLQSTNDTFRIDQVNEPFISNGSQTINCIPQLMESFLHVVTETCFWDKKFHLTEKIFKPIVAKQPFLLIGCAQNLKYLRSYGFKTFDKWWDESYDEIEDPIERLNAVIAVIKKICSYENRYLESMLYEMQEVLEFNFNLFYNKSFIEAAWNELKENISGTVEFSKTIPYQFDLD